MKSKLPNFLIVGAAKSGTSSLHNYLNQHPDVFMPSYTNYGLKVKEPRFLIKEKVKNRLPKGIWNFDLYKKLFKNANSKKAIGESTVLYLYFYEQAIINIKKYLGKNVKIIIMLRNPIDRAYSAYLFASRTHQENQSFKDALMNAKQRFDSDDSLSPMILYKELGLYYEMVKAYKQEFNDVHIILYDDFTLQTNLQVKRVFDFLNISSNYDVDTSKVSNSGGRKWDSRVMKYILMREGIMKFIIRFLLPENTRIKIKNILIRSFTSKADKMDKSIKEELLEYYRIDIQLLEKLINKDLSKWMRI